MFDDQNLIQEKTPDFSNLKIKGNRPLIVFLTGAGLSAESGVTTFRDEDGLWEKFDFNEVDTKKAIQKTPQKVFEFMNYRIRKLMECTPNEAHLAIARFTKNVASFVDVVHITQNVDDLLEKAGTPCVHHLHGKFSESKCSSCNSHFPRIDFYKEGNACPVCGAKKFNVRPSVVLFGETPYGIDWIRDVLNRVDIFMAIGTSGSVYPAADFVSWADFGGCSYRILLTKDPMNNSYDFSHFVQGKATVVVPNLLDKLQNELEKFSQS